MERDGSRGPARTAVALAGLLALLLHASCAPREEPGDSRPAPAAETTAAPAVTADEGAAESVPGELVERLVRPWKGDLDGMAKRRVVRLLVTYNATHYFVDRGTQGGATFEAGRLLEAELNRRFETGPRRIHVAFVPVARDRLLPALREGLGDIAAGGLTITPARLKDVAFSEPLYSNVSEVVVTGPGSPPIGHVEDLAGREVHVRASSSYAESLRSLGEVLARKGLRPPRIVPVDERLETEDVLEMTNAGIFKVTVADAYLARLWAQVFTDLRVHEDLALRSGGRIAWAMRKDSPKLKRFVDDFVRRNRIGTKMGNILKKRYFGSADWIKTPDNERDMERFRSMVTLFRKYGGRYDFDYLLLMAQAYQESGLDQSRRSRVGAVGVMQILPSTARDPNVGVSNVQLLENNIHAGVKYLRFMTDRYFSDPGIDPVDRHLFAFAAYNAGPARVAGLRKEAARRGLDPDRWFGNVEVVAGREIGRETVQYVANIYKYYLAYRLVTQRAAERAAAKRPA
jgi:membrane-bound lytic murein transglycosylase MltF